MAATERDPLLVSQLSVKLQSERAACEAEREAVAKDVATARANNDKIRAEFLARREERAAVDKAVVDAETRAYAARKALAQAEIKEAAAKAVLEHKISQQDQLAGLVKLLHQQEHQLKEQQQQVIEAQVAASKYKFECSDLLRDLSSLRDAHEKESSRLRTAFDVAKGEVVTLQKSLEEAKQHSAHHENHLRMAATTAKSDATAALAQVEDLRRELREAKGRVVAGEREIHMLRSETSMAKSETAAASHKVEVLQRNLQEAEHRIALRQDDTKSMQFQVPPPRALEVVPNPQHINAPRRNRREILQVEPGALGRVTSAPFPKETTPATSSTASAVNDAIIARDPNEAIKTDKIADVMANTVAPSSAHHGKQLKVDEFDVSATSPLQIPQEAHQREVQIQPSEHLQRPCLEDQRHQAPETVVAIESKSIIVRSSAHAAFDHSKMLDLGLRDGIIGQGESIAHNLDRVVGPSKLSAQKHWFEEDERVVPAVMEAEQSAALIRQQIATNMQQLRSEQSWQHRAQVTAGANITAGGFDFRTIVDRVTSSPAHIPNSAISQQDMANHHAVSRYEIGMPPRKRLREVDEWVPPTASSTTSSVAQRHSSPRYAEYAQHARQNQLPTQIPSQPVQRVQLGLQEQQQLQKELGRQVGAGGRRPKRSKSKVERLAHQLYSRKPQAHQLKGAPLKLYQAHVDHVLDRWDRYERVHQSKHATDEQRGELCRQRMDRIEQPRVAPQVQLPWEQPQQQQQPRILVASGR